MDTVYKSLNIFILPPLVSAVIGFTIAALAVFKGKLRYENILLAAVCVLWSLLSMAFICHHLVPDERIILRIERLIHLLYVFTPAVSILLYYQVLGLPRNAIAYASFAVCALFAITTQTDYYFNGLYKFSWGYIAKGGVAFQAFGAYGIIVLGYGIVLCFRRLRTETNQVNRMKITYILFSLNLTALLNFMNVPAINGIDVYPAGNLMFVPLAILAFGVLRYRLMDIRSILHITLIWAVISSIIVIPNALLFFFMHPVLHGIPTPQLFVIMLAWFGVNYVYFIRIQPVINQFFNKRKYNLRKLEAEFIEDISLLKNIDDLIREFSDTLRKALAFKTVELYVRGGDARTFRTVGGGERTFDPDIDEWFLGANHLIERNMVETNPYYAYVRDKMLRTLDAMRCSYIVPFVQNNELIGLAFMGDRANLQQLTADEIKFINNVRATAAIAFSNSSLFQNITTLKDNLEVIVEERTKELKTKNDQMIFELKIAKNVQRTLLPAVLPDNGNIRVLARIKPLMEVSGDFYYAITLPNHRYAVVIVDVSGHGVPSALLTSMIKSEIEGQIKKDQTTGETCAAINRNITPMLVESGFYFTMFVAIVDCVEMVLEFTNCGHMEPVYLPRDGEPERLNTDGFIVGIKPDARFETQKRGLRTGDRIVFLTDGLVEAKNSRGEFFGQERFLRLVRTTQALPPEKQLDEVFNVVWDFQFNTLGTDDQTLIIVEIGRRVHFSDQIHHAMELYNRRSYAEAMEIIEGFDESLLSPAYLHLKSRLNLKLNRFEKALDNINRALEKAPDRIEYLYLKGKLLYRKGKKAEALPVFERINGMDGNYKKTPLFLGRLNNP